VGAAVAAGLLLGLDAGRLRSAMSLAMSQAAGTFAAWPTTAVKFHQARGAMAGLLAASLAAEGFTAGAEPFQAADGGLFSSYSPGHAERAMSGLGATWELEQIALRLWPGATPVQALLTALLGSGRRLPPAAELGVVEIRVPPATYQAHRGLAHPASCFEALLSFHYVAATALLHGRFDIDLAAPAHRGRPDVAALIDDHVAFLPDPSVPHGGVRVRLVGRDGSALDLRQDHALGTPRCPAAPGQVEAKFSRNATARLGATLSDELLAGLSQLDQVSDCAGLLALTRHARPACWTAP
jgi:2-methylcitrate dehydratase PrpD